LELLEYSKAIKFWTTQKELWEHSKYIYSPRDID
jgi:hypothetical protein